MKEFILQIKTWLVKKYVFWLKSKMTKKEIEEFDDRVREEVMRELILAEEK